MEEVVAQNPSKTKAAELAQEHESVQPALPSISAFLRASWELFKKSWIKQIGVGVVGFVFGLAATIIAVVALVVLNLPLIQQLLHATQTDTFTASLIPVSAWTTVGVVVALWLVAISVIAATTQIALMNAVNDIYDGKNRTMNALWSRGLSKVLPVLVLGILTGFIVWGGVGLFLIPGIVFSILLSYASVEVMLYDHSLGDSMRESVRIMRAIFWEILGRGIILFLIFSIVSIVLNAIQSSIGNDSNLMALMGGVRAIVQLAVQYFSVAAGIVLYRQAKDASASAPKRSLKGMVILAALGWILFIVTWGYIANSLKSAAPQLQNVIQTELDALKQSPNMHPDYLMSPPPFGQQYSNPNDTIVNPNASAAPSPNASGYFAPASPRPRNKNFTPPPFVQ